MAMQYRFHTRSKRGGFSMLEMLVVICMMAVGYAILLPVLERGRLRGMMIKCTSNLRQTGLAFHMFAHDHDGQFPMEVSVPNGGTLDYRPKPVIEEEVFWEAFRHFQVLSNELIEPKVLICRLDSRRSATNFDSLRNVNLSFFAGLEASYKHPLSILAGDRNLLTSGSHSDTMARIEPEDTVFWSADLHGYRGNLLFADGSVHDVGNGGLSSVLSQSSSNVTIILPPANVEEPTLPFRFAGSDVDPEAASSPASPAAPMAKSLKTGPAPVQAGSQATPAAPVPTADGTNQPFLPRKELRLTKPNSFRSETNIAGVASEPAGSSPDTWPAELGRFLVGLGWRGTYLFLLLLLAILIVLELQRCRWGEKGRTDRKKY